MLYVIVLLWRGRIALPHSKIINFIHTEVKYIASYVLPNSVYPQ